MYINWKAQWIWDNGERSPRNYYLCARKTWQVAQSEGQWRIHITADTRYRLYLNGSFVGQGPARSFYFQQQFDTYDLTGLLQKGENTLAVLVSHFGEGTFQYDPSGAAGLLVQLERKESKDWIPQVITDETWQVRQHPGFMRPTIRISCQMPYEELFDAGKLSPQWTTDKKIPGFKPAKVLGPVGIAPWTSLVPRSIPFYTHDPSPVKRILSIGLSEPVNFFTGFTVRPSLLPGYYQQTEHAIPGFAATLIDSPIEQTMILHPVNTFRFERPVINGVEVQYDQPFKLNKGKNLMLIPFWPVGHHHEFDRAYAGFVDRPVKLIGVFQNKTAWTVFGPFNDWPDLYPKVRVAGSSKDLELFRKKSKPINNKDIFSHGSPWSETTFSRKVEGNIKVENLDGLCTLLNNVTIIHPVKNGCPEIFLDFGQEVVGYLDLELVADSGVVLDFNFIEEIEDGERIHYTDGNIGGFRYITRKGHQTHMTFLRRGYRYSKLTIRNLKSPLRIRRISTLFASHPVVERGSFSCSDPLLNRIWEVGRHTLRCCSEDTFTDCPTYEQTFWVGDARNEAMVNYAVYGDEGLTKRCAELPAVSLFRSVLPESQVPSAWVNILTAWSLLWIYEVEEHFMFSGDRDFLKRVLPAVLKTLRNCREKLTDEKGLLSIAAWNMFDWAGQDSQHKVVTHNQMFLVGAIDSAVRMSGFLGKTKEETWLKQYREVLINSIRKHLWDSKKNAFLDAIHDDGTLSSVISQQTNSLALLYDVTTPDQLEKIRDVPVNPHPGMVTVGSPFALFYMLEALAKAGRQADILKVVRDRWGAMVRHGATTFWETFPGFDPKWWTRSYCHAWSAAPTYFLTRYQLGAWWLEPGYTKALIAPQPVDLEWAQGQVPTPRGSISVAWEKSSQCFEIRGKLPRGVSAQIRVPGYPEKYSKLEALVLNGKIFTRNGIAEAAEGSSFHLKATR